MLQNFEIKISDEGRDSYGAKIGANDDLIVSLGLAALIVVAFWGIEFRLLLLTVVIVVIAYGLYTRVLGAY